MGESQRSRSRGNNINGSYFKIVVVKTDPGYGRGPNNKGTGKIVATFCPWPGRRAEQAVGRASRATPGPLLVPTGGAWRGSSGRPACGLGRSGASALSTPTYPISRSNDRATRPAETLERRGLCEA